MNEVITASIVIPTFNRRNCLEKTFSFLLKQTYPHDKYEIIIVDDYSTDGTRALVENIAKNSDVKISYYVSNKAKGHGIARNIGFQRTQGEFVVTTDDDCEVSADWIAKGLSYFKSPDISAVEGRTIVKDAKPLPFYRNLSLDGGTYANCNMFYRKTVLQQIGGLDENLNRWKSYGDDYALALTIMKKGGKIIYGSDVVVYHPSYKDGGLTTIKKSLKTGAIPYLYKRYGSKITSYLGFRLYRFVVGCLLFSFMVSFIFSNYLAMFVAFSSIVFILAMHIPGFTRAGIKEQIKAVVVYSISCFLGTLSFLYECFRFRVLPTKKMFRL